MIPSETVATQIQKRLGQPIMEKIDISASSFWPNVEISESTQNRQLLPSQPMMEENTKRLIYPCLLKHQKLHRHAVE